MEREVSSFRIICQAIYAILGMILFMMVVGIGVFFITFFINLFPSNAFYKATNFYPPADVKHLETFGFLGKGDGGWLKFEAGQQTIDNLVGDDFVEVKRKKLEYIIHI